MRSGYTTYASAWDFMLPMLVQGVAMSTFFLAMVTISLDGVPPDRIPSATGITNFARITGGSFAASIITTAWDRREALHQTRLADSVGNGMPLQQAMAALRQLGLTDGQAAAAVGRQMVGQAYLLASTDLFYVSAWLCIVLIGVVWLTRRPAPVSGPIAAD
jgi:DHA2 family multidrug resistance protein